MLDALLQHAFLDAYIQSSTMWVYTYLFPGNPSTNSPPILSPLRILREVLREVPPQHVH